jgi:hypothetical protein
MTGQTTNQHSGIGREQVFSGKEMSTDANDLTVGVKRGEFPDGAATILVLDHFRNLWELYSARVPRECNLLFVRDTLAAQQAMRQNPAIGVVIAQGMSRTINHPMVDNIEANCSVEHRGFVLFNWLEERRRAGEPVHEWLDSYQHTLDFLKFLQQQSFGGLVQVVSGMLKGYQQMELVELEGLRVQYMDKQNFFSGTFTNKVDKIWESIARFEQYEQKVGRKLNPNSALLEERLTKAVYPHPAEDRLFDQWEQRTRSVWNIAIDFSRAKAIEEALTWLEGLKLTIKSGDPRAIYCQASQMPEDRRTCDCREFDENCVPEYRWARYLHFVHDDSNLAVWEILDMAGLMEWMRLELELDLASQNPEHPDYGYHVRREFGEQLRDFFRPEGPSQQWAEWHKPHQRY